MNETATTEQIKTFGPCVLYVTGEFFGSVQRINVRSATVKTGIKYAQYSDAIRIEFVQQGKRKASSRLLTDGAYAVILATDQAIDPDGMYGPAVNGVAVSRYTAYDPRWVSDFERSLGSRPRLFYVNRRTEAS